MQLTTMYHDPKSDLDHLIFSPKPSPMENGILQKHCRVCFDFDKIEDIFCHMTLHIIYDLDLQDKL